MAEFPSLSLWTDSYLGDTQHLSLEEHGAYLKLLILAWRTRECRLADDDDRFQTMLGIGPKKWAKLKPVVMAFWRLEDGFWTQKKLTEVRLSARKQRDQKRGAANSRWSSKPLINNDAGSAAAYAPDDAARMPPSPSPSPIEQDSKNESPKVVLKERVQLKHLAAEEAAAFLEWYELYPRKVAKASAAVAYRKALKQSSREQLLVGVRKYTAAMIGSEKQYIAHPATWLNQGRWEDESTTTPNQAKLSETAERERRLWLVEYAIDGRWVRNTSGNGVWKDSAGVGPPPHDPGTLVTDDDLAQFPKAVLMREKLKAKSSQPPML